MTDELLTAEEMAALQLLAQNHRLLIILVPNGVPDRFVAQLTSWSNFALDTRLLPPNPLPVARKGDGLVCPYCGTKATSGITAHDLKCDYRQAFTRWGMTQIEIDEKFPES
jgi:hypothetical protein